MKVLFILCGFLYLFCAFYFLNTSLKIDNYKEIFLSCVSCIYDNQIA